MRYINLVVDKLIEAEQMTDVFHSSKSYKSDMRAAT